MTSPCNLIKTEQRKASCDLGSGTVSGHPFLWSRVPVTAFTVTALGEIHEGSTSLNTFPVDWLPGKGKLPMLSLHRHRPPSAMHALCLTFKVVDGNGSFEGEKKVWWQLDFIVQCNITERKNRLSLTLEQFVCWSGFGSRGLETSASDWMDTSDA